jgi:hypothetical protein
MANNKTKRWIPAIIHACVYIIVFLFILKPSLAAVVVMVGTHAVIDRFRLAKYVTFASQYLAPSEEWKSWTDCSATGYHKDTPQWLATWLMIIVDNTIHLTINALALRYL